MLTREDEIFKSVKQLESTNPQEIMAGCVTIRQKVDDGDSKLILQSGAVPLLIQHMKSELVPCEITELALDAILSFGSTVSECSHDVVITFVINGGLHVLFDLVHHENLKICENAFMCIGTYMHTFPILRDVCFRMGLVDLVLNGIRKVRKEGQNGVGAMQMAMEVLCYLSNLTYVVDEQCALSYQQATECTQVIFQCLSGEYVNAQWLPAAGWALTSLTDRQDAYLDFAWSLGIEDLAIMKVIDVIEHGNDNVKSPFLKALLNILRRSTKLSEFAISSGVLESLSKLVCYSDNVIQNDACWCVSSLCVRGADVIVKIFDCGIVSLLLKSGFDHSNPYVQRDTMWVLSNIVANGNDQHMCLLCEKGVIKIFCNHLTSNIDIGVCNASCALGALSRILSVGEKTRQTESKCNIYCKDIVSYGLIQLWNLREHENSKQNASAFKIIESHGHFDELKKIPNE